LSEQDKQPGENPASDQIRTAIEDGGHIQFRKCASCGSPEMEPAYNFQGTGLNSFTQYGTCYTCPDCAKTASIRAPAALLAGAIYAAIWGLVGIWAFNEGPLWYFRHFPYFIEDFKISFFLLDVLAITFYCGLIALALWIAWTEFINPLKTLLTHPVTRENRAMSDEENARNANNQRITMMSLLVFPLFVWALLLGSFWLLDALGFDLRDNPVIKFGGIALILGVSAALGKRFNTNAALVFFGMVIWLAVFITILFTFG